MSILLAVQYINKCFSHSYSLVPQISEQASIIFDDTLRQDRLPINFDIPSEPLTLAAYIEDYRMKLWDNAFPTFFRGQEAFNKTLEFVGFTGIDLIVQRLLFRGVLSLTTITILKYYLATIYYYLISVFYVAIFL